LSELDNNFKRAFIKFVEVKLPKLTAELEKFNKNAPRRVQAMENLARQLNLMPRSMRLRP